MWVRRVVYFATVAASLHLALYPLVRALPRADEYSTWLRPVSDAIRIIGEFVPGALAVWINAYARDPGRFLLSALVVGLLTFGSSIILAGKISDNMRGIWRSDLASSSMSFGNRLLFCVRTSWPYQGVFRLMKRYVAPAFFAAVFLYAGITFISHLIFDFEDSAGLICRESSAPRQLAPGETAPEIRFATKDICKATGVLLEQGSRYRITVKEIPPWQDGASSDSVDTPVSPVTIE